MMFEVKNKNYCATVVRLKKFVDLPNCDNVKAALIFGNSIIVDKTAQIDELGVYFPVETSLSPEFLGANNLYRKTEWGNKAKDKDKKGFFEQHGRVKAVKFRGHKSEGFWMPIDALAYLNIDNSHFTEGAEFNNVGPHEICYKYVPKINPPGKTKQERAAAKASRLHDVLDTGQFRFHTDTANLRKNAGKIQPHHMISITDKWHGTSAVFANILVKQPLTRWERVKKFLKLKVANRLDYALVASSRQVIKAIDGKDINGNGFYGNENIWAIVAKEVNEQIPKGFTVYGEIVGYTPAGAFIQKGYHYGCAVGAHKFVVYRITFTNADNKVFELAWAQVEEFCAARGLEIVPTLWTGRAEQIDNCLDDWSEWFVKVLEIKYITEKPCPHNNFEVPAEGIVVKIDRLFENEAYKLKNFAFLMRESKELDTGVVDTETAESTEKK